jgi:hypothetical protein
VAFGQLTFHLLEWTAKSRKGIFGDTDAAVQDGERYATVARPTANGNVPPVGSKFYSVRKQIQRNLFERAPIRT